MEKATFAAGCFWGVEHILGGQEGVMETAVGYMGGLTDNPSYRDVCNGDTGHAEVVQVEYNPLIISYRELLDVFFRCHDPTTKNRQGADQGTQYRSAIFCENTEQEETARAFILELTNGGYFNDPIVTEVSMSKEFFRAEEYHQKYFEHHPGHVCHTLRSQYTLSI